MTDQVQEMYGNRLRVRACGLLVENNELLLVNHRGLTASDFWSPPGGGVEFGEPVPSCLQREFLEETGLETKVGEFLFACEFISKPLHAIELFFTVHRLSGTLRSGFDPELSHKDQIIQMVRFLAWNEIRGMKKETLHGIFRFIEQPEQVTGLRGYFKV